jgi:hypothetical protein
MWSGLALTDFVFWLANNPARCLGLMAAADRFDYHYIHWTGDITAAV